MKNRSHRYDINRPRCRQEHKYSKYMKCLSMMMPKCVKQHLSFLTSNIFHTFSSVFLTDFEKVNVFWLVLTLKM